MLALLGYLMIVTFMILIMTGRLTAMIALIAVPSAFALIGGFGGKMGEMALEGIEAFANGNHDFICNPFLWHFDRCWRF